uniref:Uncharacterized protein n=1 Tax=Arundo donax TaxID=35708 RepID=A0A0A9AB00_ARUDO
MEKKITEDTSRTLLSQSNQNSMVCKQRCRKGYRRLGLEVNIYDIKKNDNEVQKKYSIELFIYDEAKIEQIKSRIPSKGGHNISTMHV